MSSRLRVGLIVTIVVAAALFAAFWATEMFSSMFQQRRLPPVGAVVGDLEFFYVGSTILSTINIALLIIIILTYINIYSKTKSPFTVGLIIFAGAFLLKDIMSSPFISGLFSFRAFGLGPFVFLPGIFESAALLVLLYLSIRY